MSAPALGTLHECRRVFAVGPLQFDEARLELHVDGRLCALEAKPLALLLALLLRAGAVASKRDLIKAAWGNADHVAETSLTTAMSKLRAALGESGRDIIQVAHGRGYRIGPPIIVTVAPETARLAFDLAPGDCVPGRPQWRLDRSLGPRMLNDVWLARQTRTAEARVFKFADTTERRETLRREATLSRVLHATLGQRDELVPILDWNFDARPYFIGSAFGGPDLPAWCAARGLASLPLAGRVALAAQLARIVASVHAAGVLHGDIKPSNLLVDDALDAPRLRLVDFGAGGLSDAARLEALALTLPVLEMGSAMHRTGTLGYIAPEVLSGAPATTGADIYAIGVLLYQLAVADLGRPLALGWEAGIADPLLRADIEDAASGDPARRMASAALLAERLETLPSRHAALLLQNRQAAQAAASASQAERARRRRPWIAAASLSLAAGLVIATVFALQASHDRDQARHDRDEARHHAELAQAVNLFLTQDLLGRGNPASSGKADETLMDAAQAAEESIDRRLPNEPLVAGAIYLALAGAFDSRSAFSAARNAYDHAVAAFDRAGDLPSATITRLHQVFMEAVSGEADAIPRAAAILRSAAPRVPGLTARRREAETWLLAGRSMLLMMSGDAKAAEIGFRLAEDQAEAMPDRFDDATRLQLRRRYAFSVLRQGRWAEAQTLLAALLPREIALNGPRHPETLHVELNVAEAQLGQQRNALVLSQLDGLTPVFMSVFGATHRMTLDLLAVRSQALVELERYDDALRDQTAIHDAVAAKLGEHSFKALAVVTDIAVTICRAGRPEAGLAVARSAYDGARATFGDADALTQAAAGNVAFCMIVAGREKQATPYLDMIGHSAISQMSMEPGYMAQIALMRAAVALDAGDEAQARSSLSRAALASPAGGADIYMRRWAKRLSVRAGLGEHP